MGKFTDPGLQAFIKEQLKKGKVGLGDLKDLQKQYFDKKGAELKTMVNNVVASDPNKYGMSVKKGPNGYPIYTLVNKQKQAEMDSKLATAKTPAEKKKIQDKYKPLINAQVNDPRISLTSGGAGKYKNRISNAQGRALMGPIQLGNFLEGKPYTDDHNKLGVKAAARHGGGGLLGSITKGISGAISGVSSATSKILSGAAKPVSTAIKTIGKGTEQIVASAAKGDVKGLAKAGLNVVEGAKDVAKETASANLGFATGLTSAVGSTTGLKPISELSKNVEREGQKGIEQYGDIATEIGANVATGGAYGAAKAATTALAQGGLGSLVSPEMIAKYGVDAAAAYAGVDPNMLKAGLAATQGDLKGAALQGLGSYAGLSPEQVNIASSLSKGNITEAGALAAGLNPDMVKNITSGNLTGALTAGLTGTGAAQALASQAGIQPDIMQKAIDIGKSAMSGDLKQKLLAQLGSSAGLAPNQMSLIQAASADNLEQEAMSQAGQAAGLTNEQIQLGRSIASGDTKGLTDMATRRVVSSADPYLDDFENQMMDMQIAGYGREDVRAMQDMAAQAQESYKIAKGDSLSKIAKRYGMTVDQLMAANPQIKDPSKIIAGANLNIPSQVKQTVNQATAAIKPPTSSAQEIYKSLESQYTGYIGKERKAAMKKLAELRAAGKLTADDMAVYATQIQQGKIPKEFTSIKPDEAPAPDKSFFERAKDTVTGAVGSVKDFVAGNKDLINTGVQAGSAYLGYKAGEEASEEVKKLAQQQLKEIQAQGQPFMKMTFDPERYKQERAFLQERIAKGGLTKEEEALQKQGDIRAARAAAAARKAGVEQQARLGGAAMGTSALASSLAGSQALLGEQSQTNLAREQAAAKNLESAIQRQGGLSTQQTKEEADLAQSQGTFGLNRATQAGGARGELGNIALGRAAALQNLYGRGADLATGALNRMEVPKPAAQPAPAAQPQQPPPAQNLNTKAAGAKKVTTKPVTAKPSIPKTPQEAFNLANTYIKKPEQAVTDVKKVATDLGKEKVKELIPSSLGNIFKF